MSDWNDPINDPMNYKYGIFYYNPDDDRVIVPKRIDAFGFTLNFANKWAYFVFLVLILPALVIAFTNQ